MATVMIPTSSQLASATAHLEDRAAWIYYRVRGVRYVAITSATSGRTYQVRADGQGCSCRFYAVHQALCSHALAVIEAANHDMLSLYLADEADKLLDAYDAQQRPAPSVWRSCRCGALIEPESRYSTCEGCLERGMMLLHAGIEEG